MFAFLYKMSFVVVIAGVLLLLYMKHADVKAQLKYGLVSQESTVDNEMYLVAQRRDGASRIRAANTLARLRQMAFSFIQHLKNVAIDDSFIADSVSRLHSRYPTKKDISLNELDAMYHQSIAYNFQKGESIFVCLGVGEKISEDDTIFFVLLHELAHTMRLEYEPSVDGVTIHGHDFKRLEQFLIQQAALLGLLNASSVIGRSHCNIVIPNPRDAM